MLQTGVQCCSTSPGQCSPFSLCNFLFLSSISSPLVFLVSLAVTSFMVDNKRFRQRKPAVDGSKKMGRSDGHPQLHPMVREPVSLFSYPPGNT